jgi:hypothetical protein
MSGAGCSELPKAVDMRLLGAQVVRLMRGLRELNRRADDTDAAVERLNEALRVSGLVMVDKKTGAATALNLQRIREQIETLLGEMGVAQPLPKRSDNLASAGRPSGANNPKRRRSAAPRGRGRQIFSGR